MKISALILVTLLGFDSTASSAGLRLRPKAHQIRLPIVSDLDLTAHRSSTPCPSSCGDAAYCACDSGCVCATTNPTPILTEVQRAQDAYNAGEVDMTQFVSDVSTAICTDQLATLAEVLHLADSPGDLQTVKMMMLGSFDDTVQGVLECACSIDLASLVVPYQQLNMVATCKGFSAGNGTATCAPAPTVETFKRNIHTLLGPEAMCSYACRRTLGVIITKLYGVSKLFIAPSLLFKKLP